MTDEDLDELESNIGVVNYTMQDVVRSGLCKSFVKMYHHN
jgi:phosphate starvation-inducible protein PhoH